MPKSLYPIFLCVIFGAQIHAQHISTIHGNVDLNAIDRGRSLNDFLQESKYFLVHFSEIPGADKQAALKKAGFQIHAFVPPSSFIVYKNKARVRSNDLVSFFPYVYSVPKALKTSRTLYKRLQENNLSLNGEYIVSVYQPEDVDALRKFLSDNNIVFRKDKWTTATSLIVHIDRGQQIDQLLDQNLVASLDIHAGEPQPFTSANSMFSNQIFGLNYDQIGPTGRETFFSNIEYFGANSEFRLNTQGRNHPEFGTNFPDNKTTLSHSHGSSVSLYAAAANNVNEYEDRGMASGATIVQMPVYDSIETYYNEHKLQPMTLNVSAGVGGSTVDYNAAAAEFDRITQELKGFLLCFAAGNDGGRENTALNYGPGWANIGGDDKTTKNNFTVHASGKPGEHYDWACKGPTTDGRLKPDISAEGQYGTSFASPNLAGLINVLYESYKDSYGVMARSDVVKAVILNTAIDCDKRGIDFKTGFGSINPVAAHRAIQEKRIFTGEIETGTTDIREYSINVEAGLRELKVLLYWHDAPGTPGAGKALVNDLDIELVTPDAQTILTWTLDPTPGKHYDLPTRKKDDVNNVEQVTLTDPQQGNYVIKVRGFFVPMGPQEFAVTYEKSPYHIEITSPAKDFRAGRTRTMLVTWNAAIDTLDADTPLDIFLQTDQEDPQLITTVPSTRLYYSYAIPGNFPFTPKARFIVAQRNTGIADTSEFFQVMMTPAAFRFTSACEDEITLAWQGIDIPGTRYVIYRLGEKYMEPVSNVMFPFTSVTLAADTILSNGQKFGKEDWFAIAAQHPSGAMSLRTEPISTQQTNLLNAGTHIKHTYLLCLGDSAIVQALDLARDSIRWYYNQNVLPNENALSLKVKGAQPGSYHYVIYQSGGCAFYSDTFFIDGPLDIIDTLEYGPKVWHAYVFRNGDRQQYYGRVPMRKLSIKSLEYYNEFEQINDAPEYVGCNPGFVYTIIYKREGFTKGHYKFDLRHIQESMKLYINDQLIYTSPDNITNLGVIWEGTLDESSRIRIEQIVRGRPLMDLQIMPSDLVRPAGIDSGLLLWLKGENVVTDDQSFVRHWLDNYVNALQNSGDEKTNIRHELNNINYNPSLIFNGQSGLFGKLPNEPKENLATTVAVFRMDKSSDPNARVIGFGLPPYYIDNNYWGTFSPFHRNGAENEIGIIRNGESVNTPDDALNNWQLMSANLSSNTLTLFAAGEQVATLNTDFPGLFYTTYSIGCRPDTSELEGEMAGEIAEILHFGRMLTQDELQRVHSYLGLKYGFTLQHPYYNISNEEIYLPGDYEFDVAGIAREDGMGWMQKQSTSINDAAKFFTGSTGAIASDNASNLNLLADDHAYVVWGHNNNALEFITTVNDSTVRMERLWKLQSSGNAGNFRFNYLSDVELFDLEKYRYQLWISSSDQIGDQGVAYPLEVYTAANGNEYLYADITLDSSQTQYFTIEEIETLVGTYNQGSITLDIYPNPFKDNLYLKNLAQGDRIEIYEPGGKKVFTQTTNSSLQSIPLKGASGIYLVKVWRGDEVTFAKRVAKI